MAIYDELERCIGFQWDLGNASKNWDKHRVADGEAEEIFFNDPLVAGVDPTPLEEKNAASMHWGTRTPSGICLSRSLSVKTSFASSRHAI